jgi:NarL family two-component system response regulator LiaR
MGQSTRIRVLIVDDHAMLRSGLRLFLLAFDDMEMAGEASNGEEALHLCEQLQPDVVLMDLIMPVMDGIRTTQVIHQRYPSIKIIALTSFIEGDLVQEALEAGATGYVLKNISAGELANTIRAAYAGRATLAPEATDALLKSQRADSPGFDLTAREREVLVLMIEGLSNAEIASRLVVSLSTVKFHVSSILNKLNAGNRAEAVSIALQYKLVEIKTSSSGKLN